MYIIADSGATKTNWVLVDDGETIYWTTPGMNPGTQSRESIQDAFKKVGGRTARADQAKKLFFYGASCTGEKTVFMAQLLQKIWPHTEIHVFHDLLGTARALLGRKTGIAAILGTGSSSGLYDGKVFSQRIPSLGYILGDEGSGAWLGNRIIHDYCYGLLQHDLRDSFYEIESGTVDEILVKVYQNSQPSRYLASFVPLLKKHADTDYASALLHEAFTAFFRYHIMNYTAEESTTLAITGSVAYHFRKELEKVSIELGFKNLITEQDPLPGLIEFHQKSFS